MSTVMRGAAQPHAEPCQCLANAAVHPASFAALVAWALRDHCLKKNHLAAWSSGMILASGARGPGSIPGAALVMLGVCQQRLDGRHGICVVLHIPHPPHTYTPITLALLAVTLDTDSGRWLHRVQCTRFLSTSAVKWRRNGRVCLRALPADRCVVVTDMSRCWLDHT